MSDLLQVSEKNGVPVVDSIGIADKLGVEHRATLQLIDKYLFEIEDNFGRVTFEMTPFATEGGMQKRRVAYLTEDQALYVATLSKNTQQVVAFKSDLIKKFQAYRQFVNHVTRPLTPSEIIAQGYALAMKEAEQAKAQLALAENTIKQQAPIVEYAKTVLDADGGIATSIVANDLGKSAVWLHKELKSRGIIWKVGGTWVLTAKYKEKGYAITKTFPYLDSFGQTQTAQHLYWTEAGRHFIHSLFNKGLTKTA
jgi:Rha family phage regulatory protein